MLLQTVIELPGELVAYYNKQVANQLNKIKYYDEIARSHPHRFAGDDAKALDLLEQIMSNALTIYDVFQTDFGIKSDVVKAFAVFAATKMVSEQQKSSEDEKDFIKIDFSEDITTIVFRDILLGFLNACKDGNILSKTQAFFKHLNNAALKFSTLQKDSNVFSKFNLKIGSTIISGFTVKNTSFQSKIGHTSWDDIIGNDDLKSSLRFLIDDLLCYSVEDGKNPAMEVSSIPTTVMIWGKPGTGKTLALRAASNHLLQKAERIGKGSVVKVLILGTDAMSKFKGESSANLSAIFSEAMNPEGISLLFIEDIDALFPSREELKNEPEDKQVFQTLINNLRGLTTENRGNYIVIATSNKPALLDNALLQRFNLTLEVAGPKNINEVNKMLFKHLKDKLKSAKFNDDLLLKCSEIIYQNSLVGRDIDNIVQTFVSKITKEAKTKERPDDFYHATIDEQIQQLNKLYSLHTKHQENNLVITINEYISMLQLQKQRERQERVNEILEQREIESAAEQLIKVKL